MSNSFPNFFESSLASMISTREALDKIKEMDDLLFVVEAKRKVSTRNLNYYKIEFQMRSKCVCEREDVKIKYEKKAFS